VVRRWCNIYEAAARSGADTAGPPARAQSTGEILREVWAREGVSGLYVGCNAQLLTTVLKAGLLLMGKEQAMALTLRLLSSRRRITTRRL
jgi:hypothetical protein